MQSFVLRASLRDDVRVRAEQRCRPDAGTPGRGHAAAGGAGGGSADEGGALRSGVGPLRPGGRSASATPLAARRRAESATSGRGERTQSSGV